MKKLLLLVLVILLGGVAWLWFSDTWQRIPVIEHLIGPYVSKLSAPSSSLMSSPYAPPPLPVAAATGVAPSSAHCQCPPQHQCPAQQKSPVGQPPAAPMGHPMMPPQVMPVQHPTTSTVPNTPMHPMSAPYPGAATTKTPTMGHPAVKPLAPTPTAQQPQPPVPVPSK